MDDRINESENKTSKIKAIDINLYKVIRSICKITYEKKIIKDNESYYETTLGSGFFIKLFINENELFCLMTNEHVIKEEMIKSHETIIVNYGFENELIQIKLDQSKRFIKYFPQKDDNIDITIIEILEDDNVKKEYFLLPNLNNINNINDKEIYIPQYPAKENISYSKGKIKSININNYEIIHNASTKPGSSGSPIFLKDTKEVIGVHKQGSIRKINENYGTLMYKILQLLKKEKCKIKGRLMNNQKKIYKNGDYYIGQTLKDIPQGKGKKYYKNGNIKYEGDFVNGKYEGKGIYIWESNERYDGEWLKGKKNGKGIIYYKNGNIKYDGDFVNDKYEENCIIL